MSQQQQRITDSVFWCVLLVAVSAVLFSVRRDIDQSHVVLTMLLVVVGGSVAGGRVLGFSMACVAFGLIDYFFQVPFDTMSVSKPLDWVVLIAFLAVAGTATDLLARARREAELARQRASELDSLSRLGADTLRFADPADALRRIASLVRATLGADSCTIQIVDEAGDLTERRITDGTPRDGSRAEGDALSLRAAREHKLLALMPDQSVRAMDVSMFLEEGLGSARISLFSMPLLTETRALGVLTFAVTPPIGLGGARRRFLVALAHYAALGIERMAMIGDAERLRIMADANRAKDEIVAAVSHDLRTPLTTIRVLAQEEGIADHPNAVAIIEHADRLTKMVSDVLELSRIRAGGYSVHAEINSAEDVIGATLRQVRGALKGRTVASDDGATPLLMGQFDFVQTLRVLCNLVENAIRYSPAGGRVDLTASREGGSLVFRVADRGPGVARVERDRIFEAFYRPKNQAPDGGHAGLGLSIARKLAELQGGSLAYHPRDGGGSVFALGLPAADVDIDAADAFVQPSPGNREESNGGVRGSSDDHWSRAPAERPA